MGYYLPFVLVFLIIAAFLRDSFVFTLVYFLLGTYLVGGWWSRRALAGVEYQRDVPTRAFYGETVVARLVISNSSWLPVVWLRVHESLPIELGVAQSFRQILSLGPRTEKSFAIELSGTRRGHYSIGPLVFSSGDVFGLMESSNRVGPADTIIVYPKIVPFTRVSLPSNSPMGSLPHWQPIFEDPNRVIGKRNYVSGDSLRRIDWKATASSGKLQVKQYEASIDLTVAIFLNLNPDDYFHRTRINATELAIVVAASFANWLIDHKQAVGLFTNGSDSLSSDPLQPIQPRKGHGHLMRLLENLARAQTSNARDFAQLTQLESVALSWGTTMVMITGSVGEDLWDQLLFARQRGLQVMILVIGPTKDFRSAKQRATYFGFMIRQIFDEKDLNEWRQ